MNPLRYAKDVFYVVAYIMVLLNMISGGLCTGCNCIFLRILRKLAREC